MPAKLQIAIDIGGTFTDIVAFESSAGSISVGKVLTTPQDPSIGFFTGLDRILKEVEGSMKDVEKILHATTIAGNALIERSGVKTGLITTKGFRDVLEIAREGRYDVYDLHLEMPKPLVPRYLRREVEERVSPTGEVLKVLNEQETEREVDFLLKEGVQAIAVCFLHSFRNPVNEEKVKEIIQRMTSVDVSISSEVMPYIREFERTSTTVVNSYVKPVVKNYLNRIDEGLAKRGFKGVLYIMSSAGGMLTTDTAKEFPVRLLESGPAAGVLISHHIAQKTGSESILSFDMGGTTAKGCVLRSGVVPTSLDLEVARLHEFKRGSGVPVVTPNVLLVDIGGGGGSIAWIDERRTIQIGPKSAGADPGPACYGRGGEYPTVTDADLILGYLDAGYFLGGEMKLNRDAAVEAVRKHVAEPLGISVVEAAWGIHEKVNEDIARAFQIHSAERGVDCRGYTLVAFGGAGPIHASRVASKLKMKKMLLPFRAGVLSSFGLLVTPLSFDLTRTHQVNLGATKPSEIRAQFDILVEQGLMVLAKAGLSRSEVTVSRALEMRYEGQGDEIEVPLVDSNYQLEDIRELFEKRYREIYTVSGLSPDVEITGFRVSTMGPRPEVDLAWKPSTAGRRREPSPRKVFFAETKDYVTCRVYDRYALRQGDIIQGPGVVEERESTCVVEPGSSATVDRVGNLVVELN